MTEKETVTTDDFIRLGAQLRLIKYLFADFYVDLSNTLQERKYDTYLHIIDHELTNLSSDLDDAAIINHFKRFGFADCDLEHIFYGAVGVNRDDRIDKEVQEEIQRICMKLITHQKAEG